MSETIQLLCKVLVDKLKLMPRACPVETHARGYKERSAAFADATGQARGISLSFHTALG